MGNADDDVTPADTRDVVLTDEELAALFRDLAQLVEVDGIQVKAGPGHVTAQRGADGGPTLDEAAQWLLERVVRGVQIRYRYEAAHWIDTLMPTSEGVRLVRVRHPFDDGDDGGAARNA